jgi:lysophospholipase L1-like esterase
MVPLVGLAVVGAVQRHAAAGRPCVRLIDVRGAIGSEFFNEGSLRADAFHPSALGYGRIADALAPAVLSVLGMFQPVGGANGDQQR